MIVLYSFLPIAVVIAWRDHRSDKKLERLWNDLERERRIAEQQLSKPPERSSTTGER